MSNEKEAGAKVYQLRESQGLMEDLRELGAGAVARRRESRAGTSKAEALRQAQLALLRGAAGDAGASARRGLAVTGQRTEGERGLSEGGQGARTDGAPFAHPYFWAPFILIGNWR